MNINNNITSKFYSNISCAECDKIFNIYLMKFDINSDMIKGINIDLDILYDLLINIKCKCGKLLFNVNKYNLNYYRINEYSNSKKNIVSLNADIYIFSETLLYSLFENLLLNNKIVILIPNIDSYHSYRTDGDFFYFLNKINIFNKFYIWSKTMQTHTWMNAYNIKSIFINFCMYNNKTNIDHNLSINSSNLQKNPQTISQNIIQHQYNEYILVDTGSSLPNRKYINEILDVFSQNQNIPFKLIFKTCNNVYIKHNLSKYENYNNIKIINRTLQMNELDNLYKYTKYFIYLSRYDGYGLSLANAIDKNLFIFCIDGFPWNELLKMYPRKMYINAAKDGFAKSQTKYKVNFEDFKNKLYDIKTYSSIIEQTPNDIHDFNIINKICFQTNVNNFFKYIFNKDKATININLHDKNLQNTVTEYYANNKILNLNNIYAMYYSNNIM